MHASPSPLRRLAPLAAALLVAACTDAREPTAPHGPAGPAGDEVARIRCTVDVASAAMSCEDAASSPAASATLIVGGQGRYVRLASTNVVRQADTLRADVTVQNLTDQPMGTPDGTTATGLRVFFHEGPTVTGGSGAVTVENADGAGTFTASGQPYFEYPELLPPVATSAPRTWRFRVDAGVTSFSFTVYVAAELPAEQSVLRWEQERGVIGGAYLTRIWGPSDHDVFAVGVTGSVLYYDGRNWRSMEVPDLTRVLDDGSGSIAGFLWDVSGSSAGDVVAVGYDGWVQGAVLRYDGRKWIREATPATGVLRGVWVESDTLAYAVGDDGTVLRFDGNGWNVESVPTAEHLHDVWGSGPDDVFVVGAGGTVLRFDGAGWTEETTDPTQTLWGVMGTADGTVYAASETGDVLRRTAGTWTAEPAAPGVPLYRLAVTSTGTPIVVGETGTMLQRDTAGWAPIPTSTTRALYGVWASPSDRLFAVGFSVVLEGSREGVAPGFHQPSYATDGCLNSVWAAAPDAVFTVGTHGAVLHDDGTGWRVMDSGTSVELHDVAGFAADDVYAVGDSGTVLHFDGTGWTPLDMGAQAPSTRITTAWAGPNGELYFGGSGALLRYDGNSFATSPLTDVADMRGIPGTDSAVALHGTTAGTRVLSFYSEAGWTQDTLSVPHGTSSVWASSRNDVFFGATTGDVIRVRDGVRTTTTLGEGDWIRDLWGSGPDDVYAVTHDGQMWHFDGIRWSRNTGVSHQAPLTGIGGVDGGDVWVVGCDDVVFHGRR